MQSDLLQEDLFPPTPPALFVTPMEFATPQSMPEISLGEDAPEHIATAHALEKAPGAFKTISEAAAILQVPQHVLRFWESRFSQIKPLKLRGGRRYYRPEDMQVLVRIQHLLYKQGYTIEGAKKAFHQSKPAKALRTRDQQEAYAPAPSSAMTQIDPAKLRLITLRDELLQLQRALAQAMG